MVAGALLNYTQPNDATPDAEPPWFAIFLWTMLYIPLLVLPVLAKWEIKELGFTITPFGIGLALFFAVLCGGLYSQKTDFGFGPIAEAIARTGEELFFRGFLFMLLLKLFDKKRRPWLWAAIVSSIMFASVHTQTFQPAYIANYGSGPAAYFIISRLFDVFLTGFIFALIRYSTKSILPSSIVHSLSSGGPITIPLVFLIYGAVVIWARIRKEKVIVGFE
jgi:membrane protease YdiL (CAAX protease family)